MNNNTEDGKKRLFCRKCGRLLVYDSLFCDSCGEKVVRAEQIDNIDVEHIHEKQTGSILFEETNDIGIRSYTKNDEISKFATKKKKKWIWAIIIPILVIVTLACCVIYAYFAKQLSKFASVDVYDINEVNGCPEFYGVQFGMTADEASALIEIDHNVITGYESSILGIENSMIYLKEDATYKLYGIPAVDVCCYFDVLELDAVWFTYSKEDTSFDELVNLYTYIYGESTTYSETYVIWGGKKTIIEVLDGSFFSNNDNEVIVWYRCVPNGQFDSLSFDGPEYDPCNFIETEVFDKEPSYYTSGLILDDDYKIEQYGLFSKYTLYPQYEFMGIEEGMTAISFDVDASESKIGVCSYLFLLDDNNAKDRITYIKSVLESQYGAYNSCTYTSTDYNELRVINLGFEELVLKISIEEQGIYTIQWKAGTERVTLSLTIDPNYKYYNGEVSIAA